MLIGSCDSCLLNGQWMGAMRPGVGYLNWGSGQVEAIKVEGMQRQYTRQKIKLCKAR